MLFLFFVAALSETLYYNVHKQSNDVVDYERYDVGVCYMTKNAEYFQIELASGAYSRKYYTDADCQTAGSTPVENIDFAASNTYWTKTVEAKYTKEVAFTAEAKTDCPNADKKMTGMYNNDVCYSFGGAYKKAVILEDAGLKKWALAVYNDAACTKQTSATGKVECNKCASNVYTACYESSAPIDSDTPDSSALNFVLLALTFIALLF
ncbi:hypothetical protein EIN_333550 [Entamoeba invadens IP1]|uniref:Uncharacterized protein n=1 Tax=Entamoeba invadens IP1 TaxID=370355 RepID=A0A0A1UG76_ENTIV|nr:hypothetical protein EIN_333550 [Entamoeba invadens IP1]ELP92418.1 hypothetical protein EIN_333550 [Entamoeba invadens IP1]|eukprot:XP_004259189.1 hypothetical protein EIN_333550 [Entamoeba invadens IP1]